MSRPSIKKQLSISLGLLISVILAISFLSAYSVLRHELLAQLDKELYQNAHLLYHQVEIELTADALDETDSERQDKASTNEAKETGSLSHPKPRENNTRDNTEKVEKTIIEHEWLNPYMMGKKQAPDSFFIFYDLTKGTSTPSPALKGAKLPLFHGSIDEARYQYITMPDGKKGRAVGIKFYPILHVYEDVVSSELGINVHPENYPQVIIYAKSTRQMERTLHKLGKRMILGALGTMLGSWLAIYFILNKTLRPIKAISTSIEARKGKDIEAPVIIPEKLTHEIASMAESFNELLRRIATLRDGERKFTSNVAHELRTPLSGIQAGLELGLRQPRSAEDYQQRMQRALAISRNMHSMVERLMILARFQSEEQPLDISTVDCSQLIEQWIINNAEEAKKRDLKFRYSPVKTTFMSDRMLFQMLLENILSNALHHAPEGDEISVSAKQTDQHIIIRVSNHISSISARERDLLFQPFYRRDKSRSDSSKHTGIGLSLCTEIATILGAEVGIVGSQEHLITFQIKHPITVNS